MANFYGAVHQAEDAQKIPETAKQVIKQGLSEYFLFTIEGREDIKDKEPKRLIVLKAAEVPLECVYKLSDRQKIAVLKQLPRSPYPAGRIAEVVLDDIVEITRGSDDGVQRGQVFDVRPSGNSGGLLVVTAVTGPDRAVCGIVSGTRRFSVRKGDLIFFARPDAQPAIANRELFTKFYRFRTSSYWTTTAKRRSYRPSKTSGYRPCPTALSGCSQNIRTTIWPMSAAPRPSACPSATAWKSMSAPTRTSPSSVA